MVSLRRARRRGRYKRSLRASDEIDYLSRRPSREITPFEERKKLPVLLVADSSRKSHAAKPRHLLSVEL